MRFPLPLLPSSSFSFSPSFLSLLPHHPHPSSLLGFPGLTNGDGELAAAEANALRVAFASGEEKLKSTLEAATTPAAANFWKSEADQSKLKDRDYFNRLVQDSSFRDAEAKKGCIVTNRT